MAQGLVRQGFFVGLVFACYCFVLLRTAWSNEDAFITFRVMRNFWEGYGLRWNVHERVQVYTHPLWMMIMAAFYGLTREVYLTPILVCVATSVATMWILAFRVSRDWISAIVALGVLTCSKAFMDYSTSGLENPLTHLLLAIFLWHWFSSEENPKRVALMSFITGLAILNRMDTVLLYAPCMTYLLLRNLSLKTWLLSGLGALPLFLWGTFSIVYYGFFFPNTAYAKLNLGLPRMDLLKEASEHFLSMAALDPWTLVLVLAALAYALSKRELRLGLPAAGLLLYLAYFCYAGGDYMLGRFFSAPALLSACILARIPMRPPEALCAIAGALCIVMLSPHPVIFVGPENGAKQREAGVSFRDIHGVSDLQAMYAQGAGLLNGPANGWRIKTEGANRGNRLAARGPGVYGTGPMGFRGFFADPNAIFVDAHALADPLLARLVPKKRGWRAGHYDRDIPKGYRESVKQGKNLVKDPHLSEYYDKLKIITQGPIWSRERWRLIWGMQTGQYDHLLEAYSER